MITARQSSTRPVLRRLSATWDDVRHAQQRFVQLQRAAAGTPRTH